MHFTTAGLSAFLVSAALAVPLNSTPYDNPDSNIFPDFDRYSDWAICKGKFTKDRFPNQACRLEMRRISTSAPIKISTFLPQILPWKCGAFPSGLVNREREMRRVSFTKARANHVDDRALRLHSV
ncbi:hypothetical protein BFJ70_g17322 [Fusarium oxysporum]|nr:hypothetical protein NW769_015162 [Fusarium oxysporum]KAJ4212466.1 hypothetical protein NW760_015338 [Fusarium oxysporum]RKL02900.1 hypothetical protein BFJ70_g17322 [Fusarium oxysporum]